MTLFQNKEEQINKSGGLGLFISYASLPYHRIASYYINQLILNSSIILIPSALTGYLVCMDWNTRQILRSLNNINNIHLNVALINYSHFTTIRGTGICQGLARVISERDYTLYPHVRDGLLGIVLCSFYLLICQFIKLALKTAWAKCECLPATRDWI